MYFRALLPLEQVLIVARIPFHFDAAWHASRPRLKFRTTLFPRHAALCSRPHVTSSLRNSPKNCRSNSICSFSTIGMWPQYRNWHSVLHPTDSPSPLVFHEPIQDVTGRSCPARVSVILGETSFGECWVRLGNRYITRHFGDTDLHEIHSRILFHRGLASLRIRRRINQ